MNKYIHIVLSITILAISIFSNRSLADDWPTHGHDNARTSRSVDSPEPPYSVVWVRQFPGEMFTTNREAVVMGKYVAIGSTKSLHVLNRMSGKTEFSYSHPSIPLFYKSRDGIPVLLLTGRDGSITCLDTTNWNIKRIYSDPSGYVVTPVLAGKTVLSGSLGGTFCALDLDTGALRWKLTLNAPIRTTAAEKDGVVYFAAEDMCARAVDIKTGKLIWTSAPLPGQSMRGYFPVVSSSKVIFRSNPAGPYASRLAKDQRLLADNAGIKGDSWQALDSFLKSDRTNGTAKQILSEQRVIRTHLQRESDARTFFALDIKTGKESVIAPVLYAAGCQAVGVPPAVGADGRLAIIYRTAYSNWSLGVAPLIGVGWMDPISTDITPIRHAMGAQPPWNSFWGTADETTRVAEGGNRLFFTHQGTISTLDLKSGKLETVAGERDTWGGYPNFEGMLNEWHGPERGSVAISEDMLYWVTGNRLIAIQGGRKSNGAIEPLPPDIAIKPIDLTESPPPTLDDLIALIRKHVPNKDSKSRPRLNMLVTEALDGVWRPLYTQIGHAGHQLSFSHSCTLFEALSICYPLLDKPMQKKVRMKLAEEWVKYPPYNDKGEYPINAGKPREFYRVPPEYRTSNDEKIPPIARLYSHWLYLSKLNEAEKIKAAWPEILKIDNPLPPVDWNPDKVTCPNGVVAGLIARAHMAQLLRDPATERLDQEAAKGLLMLIQWMRRYDPQKDIHIIRKGDELDAFLGKGDSLYHVIVPHRADMPRIEGLTREIYTAFEKYAPAHLKALVDSCKSRMPNWGNFPEIRKTHTGENFMDFPETTFALNTLWNYNHPGSAASPTLTGRANLYDIINMAGE